MTPQRPTINIIAAMAENRVIGIHGQLPWRLPDEMKHFVRLTTGHTVIMGRKTFESIGSKPLPNRRNIILTTNPNYTHPNIETAQSIPDAIALVEPGHEVYICGGEQAYRDALPLADNLFLTLVHTSPAGDAHFPDYDPNDWHLLDKTRHEPDDRHEYAFTFQHYERLR
jgi:dihydrofolate reductase